MIDAAIRLGPQGLTMTGVAQELGVSTPTLYKYVDDRDHLVRLATIKRLEDLPIPTDTGQHWADFLRQYVHLLTLTLSTHTADLLQVLAVESTLESELRVADRFYATMMAKGFSLEESVEIMTHASVIAIGTAMGLCRDRLAMEATGSMTAAVEQALAATPPAELGLVRRAAPAYEARLVGVDQELVEALITRIAARRHEHVPPPDTNEGPTTEGTGT